MQNKMDRSPPLVGLISSLIKLAKGKKVLLLRENIFSVSWCAFPCDYRRRGVAPLCHGKQTNFLLFPTPYSLFPKFFGSPAWVLVKIYIF
ncbi:hypothetical protein D4Z78_28690 [Okeania hirsuta]|nr:hypothetical protein D4Z78_28690 [Okeania hirsuta]